MINIILSLNYSNVKVQLIDMFKFHFLTCLFLYIILVNITINQYLLYLENMYVVLLMQHPSFCICLSIFHLILLVDHIHFLHLMQYILILDLVLILFYLYMIHIVMYFLSCVLYNVETQSKYNSAYAIKPKMLLFLLAILFFINHK